MQTDDYARALFDQQQLTADEAERERRRQVRIARQRCLTDDPPLALWAILDESVLHRQVGGSHVMREQLRHLVEVSTTPNVTVQVLPYSEGAHAGMLGSVAILEFAEEIHSPVAYVETLAGDVYLERDTDMKRVMVAYTHLNASALSPAKSRNLITEVIKTMT